MQPVGQITVSEDEEDLESLRLAALRSLKRPAPSNSDVISPAKSMKQFKKKTNKRRFNFVRTNRNGVFGNRIRNTTLITVPTIDSNISSNIVKKGDSIPKLLLPQDRYCKKNEVTEEKTESSSKFDRYNDSDTNTDSDSNEEDSDKRDLLHTASLEALMQELENEIRGDSKPIEPIQKPKKVKKIRKVKDDICDIILEEVVNDKETSHIEIKPVECGYPKEQVEVVKSPKLLPKKQKVENCAPSNAPLPALLYTNTQVPFHPIPYINYAGPVCPPVPFESQLPYNYPVAQSSLCGTDLNPPHQPMFVKYDNPLPPLDINVGILNAISAPLSPRSAAFVLQNREIIERRKKSPRRSYSRSPSPRYRRSNSRSVSPIRRLSPKNRRPLNERLNYKRSPVALTHYDETSPKRCRKSPVRSARNLPHENFTRVNRSQSLSLSPSPERSSANLPDSKESEVDTVLEARRRKFENGAVPTEGIIRLRPKSDENEDATVSSTKEDSSEIENKDDEKKNEDELLGEDDLIDVNIKLGDIFSDEESDDETEGRFKSKHNSTSAAPIKLFTKIGNSLNKVNVENSKKQYEGYKNKNVERHKHNDHSRRDVKGSKSPINRDITKTTKSEKDQGSIKSSLTSKIDRPRKITKDVVSIESKHESNNKSDDDEQIKKKKGTNTRKVAVANAVVTDPITYENSDVDEDSHSVVGEGSVDLRAQLSRKRAERQHMLPSIEKIPSRLLQNALQGAVFKKTKKSKKKHKDLASVDGKLPIHLRLGIPGFDLYNESKVSKKKGSRKRSKSRAKYEQV